MKTLSVRVVKNPKELELCLDIRIRVFCHEQGVSRDIELDGLDGVCRHYVAFIEADAVGTARARPIDDKTIKFERVAVLKEFRGWDFGKSLMELAISDATENGYRKAILNAQTHAEPFYQSLGFSQQGERFEEAGIPHIQMVRKL